MSDVRDSHLIFSINSGRSGSKYLAELFSTVPNVKSFHEAEPKMNGEFIDMINRKPLVDTRGKRRIKSKAIAELLRSGAPQMVYAETNHTFITTFHDVVLEDFHNVDVVILRRDLARVLKSFIELGYFSPTNPLSYAMDVESECGNRGLACHWTGFIARSIRSLHRLPARYRSAGRPF